MWLFLRMARLLPRQNWLLKNCRRMGLRVAVVNARWAKPLDEEMILCLAKGTKRIVTIEDHVVAGGFGSAVLELLERHGIHDVDLRVIGLPDTFVEHGAVTILKELYGLSSAHIKEVILSQLRSLSNIQSPDVHFQHLRCFPFSIVFSAYRLACRGRLVPTLVPIQTNLLWLIG